MNFQRAFAQNVSEIHPTIQTNFILYKIKIVNIYIYRIIKLFISNIKKSKFPFSCTHEAEFVRIIAWPVPINVIRDTNREQISLICPYSFVYYPDGHPRCVCVLRLYVGPRSSLLIEFILARSHTIKPLTNQPVTRFQLSPVWVFRIDIVYIYYADSYIVSKCNLIIVSKGTFSHRIKRIERVPL